MKENAMISLRTLQTAEGEEPSVIELRTKGRFSEKNGKFYVIYEESEMTGFENTTTTIKIEDKLISMSRSGKYNMKMVFKAGEKRLCNYETPYGMMPVGVNPLRLESSLTESGGSVRIEYVLDIDNQSYFKNSLDLTIKTM